MELNNTEMTRRRVLVNIKREDGDDGRPKSHYQLDDESIALLRKVKREEQLQQERPIA